MTSKNRTPTTLIKSVLKRGTENDPNRGNTPPPSSSGIDYTRAYSSSGEKSRPETPLYNPKLLNEDYNSPLTGYLYKKASTGKWQKRYFEINGHYLIYYRNE